MMMMMMMRLVAPCKATLMPPRSAHCQRNQRFVTVPVTACTDFNYPRLSLHPTRKQQQMGYKQQMLEKVNIGLNAFAKHLRPIS
jgi:hypothetical protein